MHHTRLRTKANTHVDKVATQCYVVLMAWWDYISVQIPSSVIFITLFIFLPWGIVHSGPLTTMGILKRVCSIHPPNFLIWTHVQAASTVISLSTQSYIKPEKIQTTRRSWRQAARGGYRLASKGTNVYLISLQGMGERIGTEGLLALPYTLELYIEWSRWVVAE